MFTEQLKERDSIAAAPIYPRTLNAATANTGAVDASKFNRIGFDLLVGTLTGAATVSASLYQTNESNGASSTQISGSAITNISTTNRMATLEIMSAQLTARYVYCSVTVNAEPGVVACLPTGTVGRYPPVNNNDVNTVTERLVVPIS